MIGKESSSGEEGVAMWNEEEKQVEKQPFAVLVNQRPTVVQSCFKVHEKNKN